jgi:hypothetical protein
MKKLTTIAVATLLVMSTFAYADSDHNKSGAKDSPSMSMSNNSGIMGMSADMHKHMQKMKADMIAIQKEPDPKKRKAMMEAHMKEMNSTMGMMKHKRSMMADKHMEQMAQLENRVAMLEAMVEQLVATQSVILNPGDSLFKWDETAEDYQLQ